VITNGTLTKDDLSIIVDSLESTSAAAAAYSDHYTMMKNSATVNVHA
jgi:hypothetical protein